MKSVSLTITMLLSIVISNPVVYASSTNCNISKSVKTEVVGIENENKTSFLPNKSSDSKNYQFSSGEFLLYLFFLFIGLMLLFQFWLDYDLPITKK